MIALFEFLMRLAAGMTVAMAVTSSRRVSSGFFRNHLYVVLGILTLATLVAASRSQALFWETAVLAACAYAAAVAWLYEAKSAGKTLLWLIAGGSLAVASQASGAVIAGAVESSVVGPALAALNVATASWLLGMVMMSMLLGHWYLNAPEMEIFPLKRLLSLTCAGLAGRAVLCGGVLIWGIEATSEVAQVVKWLLVLRWLCGFAVLAGVVWMAWQTLKIPNTQSATGILYIAVFAVLVGEIASLLLSAQYAFAL